jgi:integrase
MEKPPPGKRENVIDYPTYQRMRDLTATQEFRDLIDVSWETGCRPQEIWSVEKRHLDITDKRWVFPVKEAKGRRKIRIVYLTDLALAICQRLALRHPTGALFRNSEGLPWTRFAVSLVFGRMKKHLGKKYALVDFRHSFTTRSLKRGVDPVTLSFLLGHADTSMLAKTYAHLDQDAAHLRDALGKANALTTASASA